MGTKMGGMNGYLDLRQAKMLLACYDRAQNLDDALAAFELAQKMDAQLAIEDKEGHLHSEKDGRFTSKQGSGISKEKSALSSHILNSSKTTDEEKKILKSVFLSYDIFNRRAQGILNRALKANRVLSDAARADLIKALKAKDPGKLFAAISTFLNRYRMQLADLLTATQVASLLEGAREVVRDVPTVPIFPAALPPATLEPAAAVALVKEIKELTPAKQEERIYELPADQQQFVRQGLVAEQQGPAKPPPPFIEATATSGPEEIHFPIIDEAAQDLAAKNVMTRADFDTLSAAARQKAFTVAGVAAEETLEKIRDALGDNIREGADFETFQEKILESVDEGTFLSDAHMETVFRTNIQTAFSDGQAKVLSHPFVQSGFPYAAYEPIDDDRVRHEHLQLEHMGIQGTNIYRINDPVFQSFRPPWDYNCRCSWYAMTVRQAAEDGIEEAKQWLETGVEPTPPAFVAMPSFRPPAGFERSINAAPLSIRMSMLAIEDAEGHLHKGKGEGGGQFTGSGDSTASKTVKTAKDAYNYLHDAGAAGFKKLPSPVQTAISTAVAVAFSGWRASQNVAERIAKEKGATEEEAAKIRSVMAAWDLVAFKPVAVATAPLGGMASAATWIVPPVTGAYLAYSAATSPLATFRAARGIVRDMVGGAKKILDENTAELSIEDGKWITIGGHAEGDEKHVGGFKVQISDDGTILKGGPKELHGKHVSSVKAHFDQERGKAQSNKIIPATESPKKPGFMKISEKKPSTPVDKPSDKSTIEDAAANEPAGDKSEGGKMKKTGFEMTQEEYTEAYREGKKRHSQTKDEFGLPKTDWESFRAEDPYLAIGNQPQAIAKAIADGKEVPPELENDPDVQEYVVAAVNQKIATLARSIGISVTVVNGVASVTRTDAKTGNRVLVSVVQATEEAILAADRAAQAQLKARAAETRKRIRAEKDADNS